MKSRVILDSRQVLIALNIHEKLPMSTHRGA